jgi:hypothetical protein
MPVQNSTEVIRKLLMTKKVTIRAWQEEGDSAINKADCLAHQCRLGCQKLINEYIVGWPQCLYALEDH